MSVLGFVSPSVTPTNLVFNITAIPSGVYRYLKERRLAYRGGSGRHLARRGDRRVRSPGVSV
jgi:hypothetical protein